VNKNNEGDKEKDATRGGRKKATIKRKMSEPLKLTMVCMLYVYV
jgi:hypothetical protein